MKKRQIIVELTPLLDVILIMIFVLLLQSHSQVETSAGAAAAAAETAAALRQELGAAQEQLAEAQRRERTLDIVEAQSFLLTVSVQDGPVRRVMLESEGETVFVSLDAARISDAAGRLDSALAGTVASAGRETAFLVFQYDRNTVYRAEYELISGVIRDLKPELQRRGIYLNVIELDLQEE